ncbi:MAG TPA: histidine phosphatase family protein [Bacillota bacterium]|nr:histidine phosphatase family protein [Bacillota bacterium]
MSRIYLIRHGQTAWNKEEIFRGTIDVPLDDYGKKQAAALGKALQIRNLKDPLFFSSPLKRAAETAQIAASFLDCGFVTEQAFTDLNFGRWQGQAKTEIARLYPDLFRQWLTEPQEIVFPGGGSLAEVTERAEAALYRLAQKNQNRDLVIVTHRVVTKVLLCRLLGAGLSAFWKIKQDTTCLNVLEYSGSAFVVESMNDTCHLLPLRSKKFLNLNNR